MRVTAADVSLSVILMGVNVDAFFYFWIPGAVPGVLLPKSQRKRPELERVNCAYDPLGCLGVFHRNTSLAVTVVNQLKHAY